MCTPTLALTVATSVIGFAADRQAANNNEAAILANRQQMLQDLAAQSKEIDGSAAAEKSDIAIEALRKKGAVRAASGENLGLGITSQLLLQDVYAQEGRESTKVETNRKRSQEQNERDKRGVRARSQSQINSIKRPSLIGTGLQIAGGIATSGALSTKPSSTSTTKTVSRKQFFATPQGGNR